MLLRPAATYGLRQIENGTVCLDRPASGTHCVTGVPSTMLLARAQGAGDSKVPSEVGSPHWRRGNRSSSPLLSPCQ
ncbi:unnamed protein product [Ixodes persulcatus]